MAFLRDYQTYLFVMSFLALSPHRLNTASERLDISTPHRVYTALIFGTVVPLMVYYFYKFAGHPGSPNIRLIVIIIELTMIAFTYVEMMLFAVISDRKNIDLLNDLSEIIGNVQRELFVTVQGYCSRLQLQVLGFCVAQSLCLFSLNLLLYGRLSFSNLLVIYLVTALNVHTLHIRNVVAMLWRGMQSIRLQIVGQCAEGQWNGTIMADLLDTLDDCWKLKANVERVFGSYCALQLAGDLVIVVTMAFNILRYAEYNTGDRRMWWETVLSMSAHVLPLIAKNVLLVQASEQVASEVSVK